MIIQWFYWLITSWGSDEVFSVVGLHGHVGNLLCFIGQGCFLGGVETPFWPLVEPFWHPDPQYLVSPHPSSFKTSDVDTAVVGLQSDGLLGIIGDKVPLNMHNLLILPHFLIKPFWHFLVTVSWGESLVSNAGGIGPNQNDLRGMLLYFDIVLPTLQLFNGFVIKPDGMVVLFFLVVVFDVFLVFIEKVILYWRGWWLTFLLVLHPVILTTLPVLLFQEVVFAWTVVVLLVGVDLLLLVVTVGPTFAPGVHSFDLYLYLLALVISHHLTVILLVTSEVLNCVVVV